MTWPFLLESSKQSGNDVLLVERKRLHIHASIKFDEFLQYRNLLKARHDEDEGRRPRMTFVANNEALVFDCVFSRRVFRIAHV